MGHYKRVVVAVFILGLITGCSTPVSNRWEKRETQLAIAVEELNKDNPNPKSLVKLVRSFEKNKTDYDEGGYVDYIYIRQMVLQQLTAKLREAVDTQKSDLVNECVATILELDPTNEMVQSLMETGAINGIETGALAKDQSHQFSRLAPYSSMGANYNVLVHQSILVARRDGRKYRVLFDILKKPLPFSIGMIQMNAPQQLAHLSKEMGLSLSCSPKAFSQLTPKNPNKNMAFNMSSTLLDYLGDMAEQFKINFVVLPDQVYCYAGELPDEDIDGGEFLSVFRAEFVNLELLVGMIRLMVGDENIVMTDDATKSVWVRSNRTKFMKVFDLVRNVDVPEAEIEVQLELYEVSASLLHRIGARLPQLIRAGIGDAINGGSINWSNWLNNAKTQSLRVMISDGSFQINAQSQQLRATTLSQPRIRLQDGQRAKLFVGDKTPVFSSTIGQGGFVSENVNYVSTGVTLEVEAKIVGPEMVQVAVNIDSTELGTLVTTTNGSSANAVTSRTTVTRLTIQDGATEALGGYVRRIRSKDLDGMPILGATDLAPMGGTRNTRDSDVELLIFITPKIIKSKTNASNRLVMASDGNVPRFMSPMVITSNMNSPIRSLFQVPQVRAGSNPNMINANPYNNPYGGYNPNVMNQGGAVYPNQGVMTYPNQGVVTYPNQGMVQPTQPYNPGVVVQPNVVGGGVNDGTSGRGGGRR